MSVSQPFSPSLPASHIHRIHCRDRVVVCEGRLRIMGIVNVTADSFSDGGRFLAPESAREHALQLVADGADILDIGGQSTRPGYIEISDEEEISRVAPLIRTLVSETKLPLSVDTYKPAVARAALAAGAHVLNDIHGLQRAPELARMAAEHGAAVVVMHNDPTFRELPHASTKGAKGDVVAEMLRFFEKSLAIAGQAGLSRGQLILDPGIGFGKTQEQNLELIARVGELRVLGCPVLLAASRKSVIDHVLHLPPNEREEGTLTTTVLAAWQGIDMVRVHDVRANVRAARMTEALRDVGN